jgi:mannose-1-phosphate guanylyltransferase
MDAVVLAGGFGTRMRPLTLTRPKPLLPIVNEPMIDHVVRWLPDEVERVVLAVNYMADAIRDHLGQVDLGKEVVVVEEDEPLGTGGAFKNALGAVEGDDFIGLNGDVITSLDMTEMVSFHRAKGGIGTIALWKVDDPSRYGVVELDARGRILSFVEKPAPGLAPSNLINAGVYLLRTEILDLVEPSIPTSIEREVYPRVLDRDLLGFRFSGFWVDAGTPEAYLQTHRELLDRKEISDGEGVDIHHTAELRRPSHLGPGVVIGAEARVGPYTTLGEGCSIGAGARLLDSVLLPGASVGAGARLYNCILGEGAVVADDQVLEGAVLGDGEGAQ